MADTHDQIILKAREKLRLVREPFSKAFKEFKLSEEYKGQPDPPTNVQAQAFTRILNSLEALSDFMPTQIGNPGYRDLLMAAAIQSAPSHGNFQSLPGSETAQQAVAQYLNSMRDLKKGIDLIIGRVKKAEAAAALQGDIPSDAMETRLEKASERLLRQPVSKELKR